MSQTILFTTGTAPAAWMPVAADLLKRAPQGVELGLHAFGKWVHDGAALADGAGQPLADWSAALAPHDAHLSALADVAGDRRASWGGLAADAVWLLPRLAAVYPRATYLVLVDDPVTALAHALLSDAAPPASQLLDTWTNSARALLRHLQAQAGRCLVLDAQEARLDRTLAAVVLRERTGIALREPGDTAPALPAPDPLALYLAQQMAARHAASAAAFAELQACCLPLGDGSASLRATVDMVSAAARLRVLESTRQGFEAMAQAREAAEAARRQSELERDAARQDATELLQRQHQQQEALAEAVLQRQALEAAEAMLKSEREDLASQLGASRSEAQQAQSALRQSKADAELLSRQLHAAAQAEATLRKELVDTQVGAQLADARLAQVREALDSETARRQNLEAAFDEHRQAAQTERERLRSALDSAETDLAGLERRLRETAAALAQAEARLARIAELEQELDTERSAHRDTKARWQAWWQSERDRAERLTGEKQALLERLHLTHEDLAQQQRSWQRLDERLPHAAEARGAGVDLGPVTLGPAQDEPPFRGLDAAWPQARLPGLGAQALRARLVEHHGRPGLVVFADADTPPLQRWEASGREGDVPFTLFVPADDDGRERLQALSARDMLLVQALLSSIERGLHEGPGGAIEARQSADWLWQLQRLRAALPDVVHHDTLHLDAASGAEPTALSIRLDGVDAAGRRWPRWELRWEPAPDGGTLCWQRGTDGVPPLLQWPRGEDLEPASECRVPALAAAGPLQRREAWLALPAQDLRTVRAAQRSMPHWLGQALAAGTVPPALAPAWRAAALRLATRIDDELRLPLWRRAWRALARR